MFDFWSHLDMRRLLTNGSPSIDTLNHLSCLPLAIRYSHETRTMESKDEDNLQFGLQQHGRVRGVTLQAPSSSLCMWLDWLNKRYPRLSDLFLLSTTAKEMSLVLPENFRAPLLRHLSLHGIALPKGLPLLSSTITLSTLSLTHIQDACYFPLGQLVTQLKDLPHLEELSIGFAFPIPLPSSEGELLPVPIPPVTLPALRRLTFRGEDIYLDNLVAQIDAPLLERLSLTLQFGLIFTLENLNLFIHRTEGLGCLVSRVIFSKDRASMYFGEQGIETLDFCVNCEPLDWQMDSATQICIALGDIPPAVEALTLDLDMGGMPSDWQNTPDSMLWHELLLPFIGVKKLHIGSSLTPEISQALKSTAGGLTPEVLPELQELEVHLRTDWEKNEFSAFIESRKSAGRPVHLQAECSVFVKTLGEALVQYKQLTGYDPATHALSAKFDNWDSADTILEVFQDQARKFNEFRKGNEKLMEWLKPTVQIMVSISLLLGNAPTTVQAAQLIFTCISILLRVSRFLNSSSLITLDSGRSGCRCKLQLTRQSVQSHSIFPTTTQDPY